MRRRWTLLLALLLSVVTVLSVCSCVQKKPNAREEDPDPTVSPTVSPTIEPTSEPTDEPIAEPTTEPTDEPIAEPTTEPTVEPTPTPTVEPEIIVFTDVNETVFVLASGLNVRKEPDFNSAIVGGLKAGDSVTRIGYHEIYSKILFDDDDDPTTDPIAAYVSTKYLTKSNVTDEEFTVLEMPDAVYVTPGALNMRVLPSADSDIATVLTKGQKLTRIAVGSSWTKVSLTVYNAVSGKDETTVGYVKSKYVSVKNPISDATEQKFNFEGGSITLTDDYESIPYEAGLLFAASEEEPIGVLVGADSFASLEALEYDTESMTPKQYGNIVISAYGLEKYAETVNGLVRFVYDAESEGKTFTYFCALYKGTDAFYTVTLYTLKDYYNDYLETIESYAKSVVID